MLHVNFNLKSMQFINDTNLQTFHDACEVRKRINISGSVDSNGFNSLTAVTWTFFWKIY